jgi:hypothetical protein
LSLSFWIATWKTKGAFLTLRKATISVVWPVCVFLSVRMGQLVSHWTDFHEIWYSSTFRKSVEKI